MQDDEDEMRGFNEGILPGLCADREVCDRRAVTVGEEGIGG